LATAAVMAGACATETEAGYQKILNSWVGVDVDQLLVEWGPPDDAVKLGKGAVLEYRYHETVTTGGRTTYKPVTTYQQGTVYGPDGTALYNGSTTSYVPTTTPIRTYNYTCVTRFVIGEDRRIAAWDYEGNSCTAME
jgi:hypothetical protein